MKQNPIEDNTEQTNHSMRTTTLDNQETFGVWTSVRKGQSIAENRLKEVVFKDFVRPVPE